MEEFVLADKTYTQSELIAYCKEQIPSVPQWEKEYLQFILEYFSDAGYIDTYTSGSTSDPKLIRLKKEHIDNSARLTSSFFKIHKGSKALLCLPVRFIAGKMMIVRALVNGWNLYWTEPEANPLRHFDKPLDFAAFTAMQTDAILKESPEKFKAIKTVLIGGGNIPKALEEKVITCNNETYLTYGMTETITHVAVRRLNGKHPSNHFQALPGVRFSVNKDECLIIEAAHLGDQVFETNDVVQLTSPLTFRFLGRKDNVINSGGIKIFPEKIERKIAHLLTQNFFITKDEDDTLGEKMVIYIEGEPFSESELLRLRSAMKMFLHTYEIPKDFRFAPKFEYTDTDKIKRKHY